MNGSAELRWKTVCCAWHGSDCWMMKRSAYGQSPRRKRTRIFAGHQHLPAHRGAQQRPTGRASMEGRRNICNDWEQDPRMLPWREAGTR